nr:hypothetical protein CFP56_68785 [Quercus suber]
MSFTSSSSVQDPPQVPDDQQHRRHNMMHHIMNSADLIDHRHRGAPRDMSDTDTSRRDWASVTLPFPEHIFIAIRSKCLFLYKRAKSGIAKNPSMNSSRSTLHQFPRQDQLALFTIRVLGPSSLYHHSTRAITSTCRDVHRFTGLDDMQMYAAEPKEPGLQQQLVRQSVKRLRSSIDIGRLDHTVLKRGLNDLGDDFLAATNIDFVWRYINRLFSPSCIQIRQSSFTQRPLSSMLNSASIASNIVNISDSHALASARKVHCFRLEYALLKVL